MHLFRNRLRRVALATLLGIGVMACDDGGANLTVPSTGEPGGTEEIGSGAGGTGACELLTVDDVMSTGLTVVSGPAPDEAVPGDECVFELSTAPGSVVPGRVSVVLFTAEQGVAITPGLSGDSVLLESIGTEAWTSRQQGLAAARLPDRRVVWVQLAATGPDDQTARLATLLAAAVGRA